MILLLIVAVIAASLNGIFLHKVKLTDKGSIYKFNLLCTVVWCLCLCLVNGGSFSFEANSLFWGCIYGVVQTLFVLFKTAAMNSGPVSITTLMGNSSLVISIIACLVLWNEPISAADVLGLVFLTVGITLTTYKKDEKKFTKRWHVYAFLFLLCSAGVGLVFKAFSKTTGVGHEGNMIFISACVMFLLYLFICLFTGCFRSEKKREKESAGNKRDRTKFILYAIVCGLLSCSYNRLNVYLSGKLDGIIFFPVFNGGTIVLSTILSIIILREKLNLRQVIGILTSILGICVIGIL